MTLDLHKEEGRDIVRRLAGRVDVLVENFRPRVMEGWGLGPKVMRGAPCLTSLAISAVGWACVLGSGALVFRTGG